MRKGRCVKIHNQMRLLWRKSFLCRRPPEKCLLITTGTSYFCTKIWISFGPPAPEREKSKIAGVRWNFPPSPPPPSPSSSDSYISCTGEYGGSRVDKNNNFDGIFLFSRKISFALGSLNPWIFPGKGKSKCWKFDGGRRGGRPKIRIYRI